MSTSSDLNLLYHGTLRNLCTDIFLLAKSVAVTGWSHIPMKTIIYHNLACVPRSSNIPCVWDANSVNSFAIILLGKSVDVPVLVD